MASTSERSRRLSRGERERLVLDRAAALFYARGVHEVGMDELITATGLGKATVYRLYPSKGDLVGAYLRRTADQVFAAIERDSAGLVDDPRGALRAIFTAVERDISRPGFRGCAFNNASIEFDDPSHPARIVARDYRTGLLERLTLLAEAVRPGHGADIAARIAVVIDGMYVSAAHLGADGPARSGRGLLDAILDSDV